jgi:Glycosyl transferase family 11
MVVLVRSYGNHSNRLFQNLHVEAFCREHSIPFFNATIFDMAHAYAFPPKHLLSVFYIALFRMTKILHVIPYISCVEEESAKYYKDELLQGKNKLVFVGGWGFRDHESVLKQNIFFRKKYAAVKSNNSYRTMVDAVKRFDVVIGVHIRRGDYNKWLGGKYCFDNAIYRRVVQDFIKAMEPKKFLVIYFSNERLNPDELQCGTEVRFSNNPYYIDYRLMGQCHYLIGPVSTFTLWASFLHHVPYFHIEYPQQEIHLSDFKICQG